MDTCQQMKSSSDSHAESSDRFGSCGSDCDCSKIVHKIHWLPVFIGCVQSYSHVGS